MQSSTKDSAGRCTSETKHEFDKNAIPFINLFCLSQELIARFLSLCELVIFKNSMVKTILFFHGARQLSNKDVKLIYLLVMEL
jgi:hypothetical protein